MITLITGVPGTGKTAFVVSELEKVIASGRPVFTNITGLQLPHYALGRVSEWQSGTWLHIDKYNRLNPSNALSSQLPEKYESDDGSINWTPNPHVQKADDGSLTIHAFDKLGNVVGSVPYESHKGALVVIDECQNFFRVRPSGSHVPDYISAFEVHRHQGLDFWLITQRPQFVDSNVRGLTGKHIGLRETFLGRHKYEWSEVSDVESKSARSVAACTKYRLPKRIFSLYKSAEVHTVHSHSMPFMAKMIFIIVPLFLALAYYVYNNINGKINPTEHKSPEISRTLEPVPASPVSQVDYSPVPSPSVVHPFSNFQLTITAHLVASNLDEYRFNVSQNNQFAFSISSKDLKTAGYTVFSVSDCLAKLLYNDSMFLVTCNSQQALPPSFVPSNPSSNQVEPVLIDS